MWNVINGSSVCWKRNKYLYFSKVVTFCHFSFFSAAQEIFTCFVGWNLVAALLSKHPVILLAFFGTGDQILAFIRRDWSTIRDWNLKCPLCICDADVQHALSSVWGLKNHSFWWIITTGTTVRFQALWPPEPNGRQARSLPFALWVFACSPTSGLHLGPNVWNLTSKGIKDTEAHQDDFTTDRTSSKHLAQTSLQSPILCLKSGLLGGDENVECGCGLRENHGSSLARSWKNCFSKCVKKNRFQAREAERRWLFY